MDNKHLIRYFYEHVVSDNLAGELEKFVAEECTTRRGEKALVTGMEGMKEHLAGIKTTYPDLKIRIVRQFSDGDYVISEIIAEGSHLGEWLGIPPSGKKLIFTGVNIDRVQDGKITEHGGAANLFDTFWQEKIIRAK